MPYRGCAGRSTGDHAGRGRARHARNASDRLSLGAWVRRGHGAGFLCGRYGKENTMRIGIIGLGNMGQALGTALAKGGRKVVGWNRTPRDFPALSAAGATVHPQLETAAAEADLLLLVMLSYPS
ncbi:MAG: NAD(P)-binding domain-containing protein, partial [Dongiaceae bacterium]